MTVAEIVDMFETIDSSVSENKTRPSRSVKRDTTTRVSRLNVRTEFDHHTRSPSQTSTVETASTSSSPTTPTFSGLSPPLSTMSSFCDASPRSAYSTKSPLVPLSLAPSLANNMQRQQLWNTNTSGPRSFSTQKTASPFRLSSAGGDLGKSDDLGLDLFEPRPGTVPSNHHVMLCQTVVFDGIFEVMKSM